MNNGDEFFPPILNLSGTWEEIVNALYFVFCADFKDRSTTHSGLRVVFNRKILPDGMGKEEGFWHVISRKSREGDREPDFRRAERLPWARPAMESAPRPEILVFDFYHGAKKKGTRRYIWIKDHDYIIILQLKGTVYFWITAYYIDKGWVKRDLRKKYARRV